MKLNRLVVVALAVCMLISVSACNLFEWQYEEIGRFTSPDGMVDAVWVMGDGGATTGFVYKLYLVPKGTKFDKDATSFQHAMFAGDHLEDFCIVWREAKLLELHFKTARIFTYRNSWTYWNQDSPEEDRHYVVEARLVHEGEDATLSEEDKF